MSTRYEIKWAESPEIFDICWNCIFFVLLDGKEGIGYCGKYRGDGPCRYGLFQEEFSKES